MGQIFNYFARRSLLSLLLLLIPTVASLFFIKQLKSDPSFDRLLIKNDPEKIVYHQVTEQFGDDNSILIYFEGPNLLLKENLLKIRQFVWDAEEIEEVQKIDSLFTTPHFVGEDGLLSTTAALEDIPDEQSEIDRIIETTVQNPLIATRLIAKDKSSLVLNIQIDSSKRSLKDISLLIDQRLESLDLHIKRKFQTGTPSIDLFIFNQMIESQKTLLPAIIFAIALFILIGSRSIHAAVIPMIVVLIGIIWSGAFMVVMGIPIQLLVSTIPCITFILATTEIVHIKTAFYEQFSLGKSKMEALEEALNETSLPITLTALTTTLGFGAICVNKIIMLKEFGMVSAFALVSSFIVTILYTPLHIKYFMRKTKIDKSSNEGLKLFKVLAQKFYALKNYKGLIILSLIAYIGTTIFFAQDVVTDNDSINMIKKSAEPRKKLSIFEENFGGINSVFVIFELKNGNFKDPKNLELLFQLEREIFQIKEFYDAESFGGLMAHINNQMMTSVSGEDQYRTPKSKQLVAQYLLSLTRDDYEKYVSADFKRANLTVRHSISSSSKQKAAINKLRTFIDNKIKGTQLSYKITARSILNQRAGETIIRAQSESIIIMIIIIFMIVSFLFKDIRMGFAAIPPNLLPILGLFGAMGILGIPLNIGSCIVAAITVGIAVDDTIHFFTRFKTLQNKHNDVQLSIEKTIREETSPIVITSVSLSIGFSLLLLSKMVPLNQFGLLSAIVILLAMISDLVVTPAVLSLLSKILTNKNAQD